MSAEQRVAVVTGASQGMGLETVRMLAEQGYAVVLTARTQKAVDRGLEDLGRPDNVGGRVCDVSDQGSVDALFDWLADEHGRIDVLVNNAGRLYGGYGDRLPDTDLSEVAEAFDNNTLSALRTIMRALPMMNQAGYGRIVNVSSALGTLKDMKNGVVPYRISKTAMNAITRIVSNEVGDNVKINSVGPGWVRTEMSGPSALRSVAEGTAGIVWAATLPDDGPNGGNFFDGERAEW